MVIHGYPMFSQFVVFFLRVFPRGQQHAFAPCWSRSHSPGRALCLGTTHRGAVPREDAAHAQRRDAGRTHWARREEGWYQLCGGWGGEVFFCCWGLIIGFLLVLCFFFGFLDFHGFSMALAQVIEWTTEMQRRWAPKRTVAWQRWKALGNVECFFCWEFHFFGVYTIL